jgi:hypothetical protein
MLEKTEGAIKNMDKPEKLAPTHIDYMSNIVGAL